MAQRFKLNSDGKMPSPSLPLRNEKHEDYCQIYIRKGEKKKAYMLAFGCQESKSVRKTACNLHARKEVQARLKYLRGEMLSFLDLDDEALLLESFRLSQYDIRELIDPETGEFRPVSDWPEDISRCLKGLKMTEKVTTDKSGARTVSKTMEPVFHAKDNSLDRLMKHKGLFDKDNSQRQAALYLEVGRADD